LIEADQKQSGGQSETREVKNDVLFELLDLLDLTRNFGCEGFFQALDGHVSKIKSISSARLTAVFPEEE
jgi:hypothetical protein